MISYQNIIDGNGVNISITGMMIVFSGLIFMTLYIFFLPRILNIFKRKPVESENKAASDTQTQAVTTAPKPEISSDNEADAYEIASVIGIVLHLELGQNQFIDNQQITILRDEYQVPVWRISRKLRVTPFRRS